MNDELSQFGPKSTSRPLGVPLQRGPRVHGGQLLEGAPQIGPQPHFCGDAPRVAVDDPASTCRNPHSVERSSPEAAWSVGADLDAQLCALGLRKNYQKGPVEIPVLRGVSLSVREGEMLAIVGKSGSGKSTLLHLLATLDAPDEGEIYFEGQRIDNLAGAERDALRNGYLGMIFQFYHLLPELTTLENVLMPLMIGRGVWSYLGHRGMLRRQAMELLDMVGLGHRLRHRPRELSGGEMQRAAIARALIAGPRVLLADEPTGNLDYASGREILELLHRLNAEQKLTIVMVTHDLSIAQQADRSVRLVEGRIESPHELGAD